jgi:hypothetical protein
LSKKASPNSRGVASAGADGTVTVWSTQSGNRLWQSQGQAAAERPPAVGFAPSTRYVAVGRANGLLVICDLKTQHVTRLTSAAGDGPTPAVTAVAFGPGGATLAAATVVAHPTAGETGTITLWNLGTGQAEQTMETAAPVAALAFPAGGDLLVSGLVSGQVVQWQAVNGTAGQAFDHDAPLHELSISRSGKRILTIGRSELRLWDLAEKKVTVLSAEPPATFASAALSPDGARVASAGSGGGAVKVWPVASAQGATTAMDEMDGPATAEEARIAAQIDILGMQQKELERQIKHWKDVAAKRSIPQRSPGDMPMNQMSFPALLAVQRLTVQKAELLQKVQALQDKLRRMKQARKQQQAQGKAPDDAAAEH